MRANIDPEWAKAPNSGARASDSALCGMGVRKKDRSGNLANPLAGVAPEGKWPGPIAKFRNKIKLIGGGRFVAISEY